MNYLMYYDYDNYDIPFECMPVVRHGTAFEMFGCRIKFYMLNDPQIKFWVDGAKHSRNEAYAIFDKVSKILSYIFSLSFSSHENFCHETPEIINVNSLLARKSYNAIQLIESKINKLNQTAPFFYEMLDLLSIAYENMFKCRDEDSFIYFFKVIERIAKQHYLQYMQRHNTKAKKKSNKDSIRTFVKEFAFSNLDIQLTENMLDRKVDLFYREIIQELYGSTFNKISLLVTKENIDISIDTISTIVKIRNKIAHGDIVDEEKLSKYLVYCERLALEMFSKYFFKVEYKKIHIASYRYDKI